MATMNSPDSASGPPVEVLAIHEDRGHNYHIVRARTGDMVRYYRVFAALSNRWPKGWQSPDSSFRLPIPRLDPSGPDAKCIDLYDPQPPWPAGGGRVAYGPGGEAMPLARAIPVALTGVPGVDHAVKLEYATFECVRVLQKRPPRGAVNCRQERLSVVRHPALAAHGQVMMKLAAVPTGALRTGVERLFVDAEASMGHEIRTHQAVAARGLAPAFLGLVTERGRGVVGYCMAYLADAGDLATRARQAGYAPTAADARRVRAAFARLHAECRLFHGDCHLGNVLRRADGAIFLIDFELAMPLNSAGCVDGREDCTADAEDYEVDQWIGYTRAKAARSRVAASDIKSGGLESEEPAKEDCSSQH